MAGVDFIIHIIGVIITLGMADGTEMDLGSHSVGVGAALGTMVTTDGVGTDLTIQDIMDGIIGMDILVTMVMDIMDTIVQEGFILSQDIETEVVLITQSIQHVQ